MQKAVLFDWAGTCATEGEPLAAPILSTKTGLMLGELNARTADLYDAYAIGQLSEESFWQKTLQQLELDHDTEVDMAELSRAYLASSQPYLEVLEVAKHLRERGVLVGLLSNSTPQMRDHLRATIPTAAYFDHEAYSCDPDVVSLKPHHKPFDVILAKMRVAPEDVVFIDNAPANIAAAQQLGMSTMLFVSPDAFVKEFKVRYTELYE